MTSPLGKLFRDRFGKGKILAQARYIALGEVALVERTEVNARGWHFPVEFLKAPQCGWREVSG